MIKITPETPEEADLLARIAPDRIPRHVAVIMDGNGRWAKRHGFMERIKGHEAAVEAVRATVRSAGQLGIAFLTLYAFSQENWSRPKREVSALMRLLEKFLYDEIPEMMENNVRLIVSGEINRLPDFVRKAMNHNMNQTGRNTGLVVNLAVSYGARHEIVEAARKFAADVLAQKCSLDSLTIETFPRYLYHPELPDPELLIRTSGEMRISNFLLWQIAYTELVVMPVLWPDFRRVHLLQAIVEYQSRERRFGGVSGEAAP
ncbi:MAG: isoprenyl transferase [Candidatus Sumerlaeia bacterium]|nr:isoprenyl transferase [Candidatus Sumerlaeia bacterium]